MTASRWLALAAVTAFGVGLAVAADKPIHMHKADATRSQVATADVVQKDDAQTAADYRAEATKLAEKAAEHRRTAQLYRSRGAGKVDGARIARHCDSLAKNYETAAKEASAIADELSK